MPTKRIEYFPLDTRVFYDMKFELLVAEFGLEAAAIAIKLLCEIYGNCFYLDWNANRCTIFTLYSGSTFSREQVQAIVDYLLEIDFFDKNMYEAYSILTSKGIQRRYFQITRRRKRNTMEHPEYLLVELPGKSNSIGNVSTKTELKPKNVDKNEIQVDLNSKNVDNFSQRKGHTRVGRMGGAEGQQRDAAATPAEREAARYTRPPDRRWRRRARPRSSTDQSRTSGCWNNRPQRRRARFADAACEGRRR